MKKRLLLFLTILSTFVLSACGPLEAILDDLIEEDLEEYRDELEETADQESEEARPDPDGYYSNPDEVALYIYSYDELPDNYLTKAEARELGWEPSEGNLWEVTEEMLIGGDTFGNREGILPEEEGRQYYEADVNYEGGFRGAERLVYSNDGLIYYTDDHYGSFQQLYGEE
ncbi:ribonuclease domain-containing protein [Alkalibacterium sp. f15]|uniref:ribonuclease domain-containing protein n=1 Tax=Alkalibacterium sp. f15 TaxID=3414029 RepID=UPI003BF8DF6E